MRPAWHAVRRFLIAAGWVVMVATGAHAQAGRNVAPGFEALPKDAKVLLAPLDVELFSMSAGGVLEPKADWTEAAARHMKLALHARASSLGLGSNELAEAQADEHADLLSLHAAVARSIAIHHVGILRLPTKDDKLDWTFGDALQPLRRASDARYALFTWVRDSYASPERVAMMVGMALLGVGMHGGAQIGYASLVDLDSGQVLWFNQLLRGYGDLRTGDAASESVNALLSGFPVAK